MQKRLSVLFVLMFLLSVKGWSTTPAERDELLKRNNPVIQSFDSLALLSVGNGGFAMTIDPTGLQTFPERYAKECPLGTKANWTDKQLGIIGFEFPSSLVISDFADLRQTLVLSSGIVKSSYTLQGNPVSVLTAVHPKRNLVASHIKSSLPIPVRLCFPHSASRGSHHTTLLSKRNNAAVFKHIDNAEAYYIVLQWQGNVSIAKKSANHYVITPESGHFAFSCEYLHHFTTTLDDRVLPTFKEVAEQSAEAWSRYWSGNCIKTLADSTHLYTRDQEHRLMIDCYNSAVYLSE